MQRTAIDFSALVAAFDRDDKHHSAVATCFKSLTGIFVTNIAVLTELAYLLSFSDEARRDCLQWIAANFETDNATASDIPRIIEIMSKYADLPADFADASLVAICERLGIEHIATLDRDFDVYRLAGGNPLVNVLTRA